MSSQRFLSLSVSAATRDQLVLTAVVFVACVLGILSRPAGYIAVIWPANALLLGLLLRNRALALQPLSWLLAFSAYLVADLVTGSDFGVALSMNLANLLGVAAGWLYFRRQSASMLEFKRQHSVLHLLAGSAVAALASALPGALASGHFFGAPLWPTLQRWFAGELFDMLLILPVLLRAPQGWMWQWRWTLLLKGARAAPRAPLAALLVSIALVHLLQGPGAVGYLVPALVWCAMGYGVWGTALLTLLACTSATALLLAGGVVGFSQTLIHGATSFQVGVGLISLAPLTVSVAHELRARALRKLRFALNHDELTNALSRRTLMERGRRLVQRMAREGGAVAILMADLDHFKRINDSYGHAQGDLVLRHFTALALRNLRAQDLFGRIGGEEFALVLPEASAEQALAVAERIRNQMREHPFGQRDGIPLYVTVSMGLRAAWPVRPDDTLERLLSEADAALYHAKKSGRDQVHCHSPLPAAAVGTA
ncbi:GGDEF domain-containing protein [Comamonas flocculans]|uniref:diguanylate cyclase n=1 Tax=Comamonas flocculans TaxID=2597701 RepID=A0A5B8RSW8_9BURK|nr:GGDEF domain-containing protein [Comamonas flocculans]QEA12636.1 diguanylate cyclase [Comamonas flocculans]